MTLAIRTPRGQWVSAGQYAQAWRTVIMLCDELQRGAAPAMLTGRTISELRGWDIFPRHPREVRADMRRMLDNTITRHDRTQIRREVSERRLFALKDAAVRRGAIRFECRWCGSPINAERYLQHWARFCDESCKRSYCS